MENENDTQIESGCTRGRERRGRRPCGQGPTTQRGQSVDGDRRRGARGIRGGGVESVGQVLVEGQHEVDVGEDSGREHGRGGLVW